MSNRRKPSSPDSTQILEEAGRLDARRLAQINNQIGIINRLLEGHTYDDVMRELTVRLSDTEAALDEAKAEIERLRDG